MLGLKLWSTNTDYYLKAARGLYEEGFFDYIELYFVPDSLETAKQWKTLEVPFTVHAPHFAQGVNLADPEKENFNRKIYVDVARFMDELAAKYVVVHSGTRGTIEETARQLKLINIRDVLIENKPYRSGITKGIFFRGATYEELDYIINELNCGFCLDVGHAICAYNSLKEKSGAASQYDYVKLLNGLNPTCYHISDDLIENEDDKHMHLGAGSYDWGKIFQIIDRDKDISIETEKDSKENLDDFKDDVAFVRRF